MMWCRMLLQQQHGQGKHSIGLLFDRSWTTRCIRHAQKHVVPLFKRRGGMCALSWQGSRHGFLLNNSSWAKYIGFSLQQATTMQTNHIVLCTSHSGCQLSRTDSTHACHSFWITREAMEENTFFCFTLAELYFAVSRHRNNFQCGTTLLPSATTDCTCAHSKATTQSMQIHCTERSGHRKNAANNMWTCLPAAPAEMSAFFFFYTMVAQRRLNIYTALGCTPCWLWRCLPESLQKPNWHMFQSLLFVKICCTAHLCTCNNWSAQISRRRNLTPVPALSAQASSS